MSPAQAVASAITSIMPNANATVLGGACVLLWVVAFVGLTFVAVSLSARAEARR